MFPAYRGEMNRLGRLSVRHQFGALVGAVDRDCLISFIFRVEISEGTLIACLVAFSFVYHTERLLADCSQSSSFLGDSNKKDNQSNLESKVD